MATKEFSVAEILKLRKDELVSMLTEKDIETVGLQKADLQIKVLEMNRLVVSQGGVEDEQFLKADSEELEFKSNLPTLLPLVPEFNDKEIESFFALFERVAHTFAWKKKFWPLLIQQVLRGKAREVYLALPMTVATDYDVIKTRILSAYQKTAECYRRSFRNAKKTNSWVDFLKRTERDLGRWFAATKVQTIDDVKNLILTENFQFQMTVDEKTLLSSQPSLERRPFDMAALLDDLRVAKEDARKSDQKPNWDRTKNWKTGAAKPVANETTTQPKNEKDKFSTKRNDRFYCTVCNKSGHTTDRCFSNKKK